MNKPKIAFLILRVEKTFKTQLVRKAKNVNLTLSEYVRRIIEKFNEKN